MIPKIDPAVRHVGVSYLRKLNASQLRQLEGAIVVCDNSEPLAVIVSFETFIAIQKAIRVNMEARAFERIGERPQCGVCGIDLTSEDLRAGRCAYCKNSLSENDK